MERASVRAARVALWSAAVIGVGVAIVFIASEARLRRTYRPAPETVRAAPEPDRIARGRHIATAISGCATCHGDDLGGSMFIDGGPFGRWAAPNLTTGRGGAASTMTDAQLESAIRHGVRPDGRSLHFMPSKVYAALADDDLAALLGYLRSAPPVDRELPSRRVGPIARALLAAGRLPIQSAAHVPESARHEPRAPIAESAVIRGRYLAVVGGCHECHGEGLSGGPIPGRPDDQKPASNLTPEGLRQYDEAAFIRTLRTGVRPGGAPIDAEEMPWRTIGRMTDDELHALWEYLRSLPPKPYGGR